MGKSNNAKPLKSEHPIKKKKGRPKKKTSKLNSPTKNIEKEERKGRGRPRKTAAYKKSDSLKIPMMKDVPNDIIFVKDIFKKVKNETDEPFQQEHNFSVPLGKRNNKINNELLEKNETLRYLQGTQVQKNVLTRRGMRMKIEEEALEKNVILQKFEQIEEMLSCLGMMVFALHKKTVNKDKKTIIDDYIRQGFNSQTAEVIKTNLLKDVNYFEKTRKNSVHVNIEGSMISGQGSVKQ